MNFIWTLIIPMIVASGVYKKIMTIGPQSEWNRKSSLFHKVVPCNSLNQPGLRCCALGRLNKKGLGSFRFGFIKLKKPYTRIFRSKFTVRLMSSLYEKQTKLLAIKRAWSQKPAVLQPVALCAQFTKKQITESSPSRVQCDLLCVQCWLVSQLNALTSLNLVVNLNFIISLLKRKNSLSLNIHNEGPLVDSID